MPASAFAKRTLPRQRVTLSQRQPKPTLFLVCAVLSIALLNPLLCILHCQIGLSLQHQHTHAQATGGFICDLALSHTSGSEDQLQSDLPQTPTPRAVHEAIQPSLALVGLLSSIYLGLLAFQNRPHSKLASPPLLPPPRYSI